MSGAVGRGMRGNYVLNENWQIFVDVRPVPRDAINSYANVQPKAVFSYAMTVMDKICGWGEEPHWVGFLFAACIWIYTTAVLCNGHDSTQEFLRRRMLSIMESVSWVCEEEEHEWVSPLTISLKEEVLAELDYESSIPCVVQWGIIWIAVPSRLNVKLDVDNTRIAKYHEVTNLAIEAAIKAHRTRFLWSIAKVLDRLRNGTWTRK